jgi:UDP-N-acetylmuramoylalanine--D-glutamate ligase
VPESDPPAVHRCRALGEAVQAAARVAQAGDVVLLSPGGTSFDAYRDFEARGEHYRMLVQGLN